MKIGLSVWFLITGLFGVLLGWIFDNERGAFGVGVGWLVCFVPFVWLALKRWVANSSVKSKMVLKQGLPVGAREILARMAWVLGASFTLYWHFGPRLGIGFWLAVLVFYQFALAIQTIERLDRPRS